jgi:hypothetical protein
VTHGRSTATTRRGSPIARASLCAFLVLSAAAGTAWVGAEPPPGTRPDVGAALEEGRRDGESNSVARIEAYAGLGPAPHDAHGFRNLDPEFRRASWWRRTRFYLLGLSALLNGERRVAPLPLFPSGISPRFPGAATTVTWVGHSTLLIQLDGINILTDPTWSDRVGPLSGTIGVGRYTPPGLAFDDLPRSTSS